MNKFYKTNRQINGMNSKFEGMSRIVVIIIFSARPKIARLIYIFNMFFIL